MTDGGDEMHPARVTVRHVITVPLPLSRTLPLFTPEGERLWISGWEPTFPAGENPAGAARGDVFTTSGDHGDTFWAVADRDDDYARYARITPGATAGFVEVRCRERSASETEVEVSYDLTALSGAGRAHLAGFADHFTHEIDGWQRLIETALADGRI